MTALSKFLLITGFIAHGSMVETHAGAFTFSYVFDDNMVVSGSFQGTQNGNVITGLSDIHLNFDGTPHTNFLYGSSMDEFGLWRSGGAVASVDGSQNNFLFIDGDYPDSYSYSEYFYMFGNSGNAAISASAYDQNSNILFQSQSRDLSKWELKAATTVSVPDTGSTIALMAIGLCGVVFVRRHLTALALRA